MLKLLMGGMSDLLASHTLSKEIFEEVEVLPAASILKEGTNMKISHKLQHGTTIGNYH